MNRFFDSKPIVFLGKMVDVVWMNILFVICCIPIVTAGASFTALYYTTVKVIRRDVGTVTKEFFHSFRLNLVTAIKAWILYFIIEVILVEGLYMLIAKNGGTALVPVIGLTMALIFVVAVLMIYGFCILSRFSVSFIGMLKNAAIISVKQGKSTLIMLVITLVLTTLIVSYWSYLPLVILLIPGIYTLFLSLVMEPVLLLYTPEEASVEENIDDDIEQNIEENMQEEKRQDTLHETIPFLQNHTVSGGDEENEKEKEEYKPWYLKKTEFKK